MKDFYLIGAGLALALLLLAAGALLMLRQRSAGGYDVRGRVAGFSDDPRTVIVEHEEIEGYMPPMTMPLTAADSSELDGLAVGDAVGFRLHTSADSSWITGVERLPDSAVVRHPAAATSPRYTLHSERPALEVGETVPDFTLSRPAEGAPVQLSGYEGQMLILTFIYTRCPLPDYCPLMSKNFTRLREMLPARLRGDVTLLSVSFDPEHDTKEVLQGYARRYVSGASNAARWRFATGTEAEVRKITNLFGVFTKQESGEIVHNLRTVLIGPSATVREIWRGNEWQPEDVLQAATRVAEEERLVSSANRP